MLVIESCPWINSIIASFSTILSKYLPLLYQLPHVYSRKHIRSLFLSPLTLYFTLFSLLFFCTLLVIVLRFDLKKTLSFDLAIINGEVVSDFGSARVGCNAKTGGIPAQQPSSNFTFCIMAENVDDQLAQLMSLGFDIGICKEALSQTGNVQAATEWYAVRLQAFRCNSLLTDVLCRILDRQGGQSKSPVLCLGQQPSNANPYVDNLETRGEARVTSRHDEQEAVRLREKSAKMALESKRAKRQDKEVRRSDAVLQQ